MNETRNILIDELAEHLRPVRAMRPRDGLLLAASAVLATLGAVLVAFGSRPGLMSGQFSVFFPLANGLLLLLGVAAATSTVAMASPRVGNRHDGTKWAMAMAAVLPLTAIALLAANQPESFHIFGPDSGADCFVNGTIASTLVAAALVWWLRRGAPVTPRQAGLHLGVAAGALGSVAYGISCPADSLYHLAIWHFLPVPLMGLAGMLAAPPLVRW
jgi:hypothetical protein